MKIKKYLKAEKIVNKIEKIQHRICAVNGLPFDLKELEKSDYTIFKLKTDNGFVQSLEAKRKSLKKKFKKL